MAHGSGKKKRARQQRPARPTRYPRRVFGRVSEDHGAYLDTWRKGAFSDSDALRNLIQAAMDAGLVGAAS